MREKCGVSPFPLVFRRKPAPRPPLDGTDTSKHNTRHENHAVEHCRRHLLRHYYFELVHTGWRAAPFFAS
jgi:hypothetical protein